MKINKVYSVSFSPLKSTARVVDFIGRKIAVKLSIEHESIDFTLSKSRNHAPWNFKKDDLTVFGTPTYAGRVPNLILPFIKELFKGDETLAIPVVTFGNRNFDSSLTELSELLYKQGFWPFAAAGVASRHVFSDIIGRGRPDEEDFKEIECFIEKVLQMMKLDVNRLKIPLKIRNGEAVGDYYTPLKLDGAPARFLKAKPVTDPGLCINCHKCALVCPFGSIAFDDVSKVTGVCAKCQACIKNCPKKAKHFDDPDFLSHKAYLEAHFMERKEAEFYFSEDMDGKK